MFFDSLSDLLRIVVVGVLAYMSLVLLLRASGKRTLSQMNAFDFVVTVALGSTLATVLLSSEVSFSEGILALALLIALQYAVAYFAIHEPWTEQITKSEPSLLLYRGEFIEQAMRSERLSRTELLAAIRQSGLASHTDVLAIVLETNGKLSVLPMSADGPDASALEDLRIAETSR